MKQSLLFVAFSVSLAQSTLVIRQMQSQRYLDSVCSPNITVTSGTTIPPCISVQTIQAACAPKGTLSSDYLGHAECLCSPPSTFFADWLGCRNCLLVHGGSKWIPSLLGWSALIWAVTQRDHDTYASILSSASNVLCSGTPTAKFNDIFSTLEAKQTPDATGGTAFSDQYPSSTAVSLYYTAPGPQGSGAITG
jgi:hypothetical protein